MPGPISFIGCLESEYLDSNPVKYIDNKGD
jgi:hypothetical protein